MDKRKAQTVIGRSLFDQNSTLHSHSLANIQEQRVSCSVRMVAMRTLARERLPGHYTRGP